MIPRLADHARLGKDRVTGEAVLLAPETAITLNPTGTAILGLCDGRRSLGDIVKNLSEVFEAPEEELAGDVREFLERLADRGYLRWETREE